jgi:hypothetical protein
MKGFGSHGLLDSHAACAIIFIFFVDSKETGDSERVEERDERRFVCSRIKILTSVSVLKYTRWRDRRRIFQTRYQSAEPSHVWYLPSSQVYPFSLNCSVSSSKCAT